MNKLTSDCSLLHCLNFISKSEITAPEHTKHNISPEDKTIDAQFSMDEARLIGKRYGPACVVLKEVVSVIFVTTP